MKVVINGSELKLLVVCWCELDSWNLNADANGSDKSASYFISICEGEEL